MCEVLEQGAAVAPAGMEGTWYTIATMAQQCTIRGVLPGAAKRCVVRTSLRGRSRLWRRPAGKAITLASLSEPAGADCRGPGRAVGAWLRASEAAPMWIRCGITG